MEYARSRSGLLVPGAERSLVDPNLAEVAEVARSAGARMTDWPVARYHLPVISSVSAEALGCVTLSQALNATIVGSVTWKSANTSLLVPVLIESPYLVKTVWWVNGTTASGNIDCGVYTTDGTLIFSAGSTAQSGTSAPQKVALGTAVLLTPGTYYMALVASATTSTVYEGGAITAAGAGNDKFFQLWGCAQIASNLPLATGTLASCTSFDSQGIPLFGISTRASTLI